MAIFADKGTMSRRQLIQHIILLTFLLSLALSCSSNQKKRAAIYRDPAMASAQVNREGQQIHDFYQELYNKLKCPHLEKCNVPPINMLDEYIDDFKLLSSQTIQNFQRLKENYTTVQTRLEKIAMGDESTGTFRQAYLSEVQAMQRVLDDFNTRFSIMEKRLSGKSVSLELLLKLKSIGLKAKQKSINFWDNGNEQSNKLYQEFVKNLRQLLQEGDEIWGLAPLNLISTMEIANPTYIRKFHSVAPYLTIDKSCINKDDSTLENNIYHVQFPVLAMSIAKNSDPSLDANNLDILYDHQLIKRMILGDKEHQKPLTITCTEVDAITEDNRDDKLVPHYNADEHQLNIKYYLPSEDSSFQTMQISSGLAVRKLLRKKLK
jgi:hypothetical protein